MNKYCILSVLHEKLASYESTLMETSYDDNKDEYLCLDKTLKPVYSFDQYVRNNYDLTCLPASPDAIYLGNKKLFFVEFKNQHPRDIDPSNIQVKFEKGTKILQDDLLKNFIPQDVEYIFCIVYKPLKTRYFNYSLIERNIIRFGLSDKNDELGGFYSKIITEALDFYKKEFIQLSCEESI